MKNTLRKLDSKKFTIAVCLTVMVFVLIMMSFILALLSNPIAVDFIKMTSAVGSTNAGGLIMYMLGQSWVDSRKEKDIEKALSRKEGE